MEVTRGFLGFFKESDRNSAQTQQNVQTMADTADPKASGYGKETTRKITRGFLGLFKESDRKMHFYFHYRGSIWIYKILGFFP